MKLNVVSRQSNSLFLEWSLLSEGQSNAFILYYTLQYRTDDSDGLIKRISPISPETTTYQLNDLRPFTEYIVELYATNKHFSSEPSRFTARTTEAGKTIIIMQRHIH